MTATRFTTLLIILFLSSTAHGDTATKTDLKQIMQDLQNDTALIVEGLLVDDFQTVASAAARVANHPRIPPSQVALVAAELGSEMPTFKQYDTLVHDLALSIGSAAEEGDSTSIADKYQKMLDGCLACHASYRERVTAVLDSN